MSSGSRVVVFWSAMGMIWIISTTASGCGSENEKRFLGTWKVDFKASADLTQDKEIAANYEQAAKEGLETEMQFNGNGMLITIRDA